jgi:hypothetical protein
MLAVERMVRDQNVNLGISLDIINKAQESQSKALTALEDGKRDINFLKDKIQLMADRERAFDEHREQLEAIPSDKLDSLDFQGQTTNGGNRPAAPEISFDYVDCIRRREEDYRSL